VNHLEQQLDQQIDGGRLVGWIEPRQVRRGQMKHHDGMSIFSPYRYKQESVAPLAVLDSRAERADQSELAPRSAPISARISGGIRA
jgi:hypothetical protein